MPNDGGRSGGNRPGRGDWRGGGRTARPAPGAKAAAGSKGHDWARHKTDDSAKLIWIFRAKVALGVLAIIGLFAAIVWMLPRPTTTPFISLVISEYQYPAPPNAWAYDDVENIRRLLARDGENRTGGEPLAVTEERQIIWRPDKDEWLGNLRREVEKAATIKWYQTLGRGPGKGAVIIYLSGLGVVNDDGNACLLLPSLSENDSIFDPARRMPMRELFDELFYDRDNERERLPRDVLKLVVLDAGRIDQDWEMGLPYNPFVESLKSIVESDLPVSNLFVLNAADAGQKAWPSPELGGTVFGHFVRRGLQGHADGYAEGSAVRDGDRFITVAELHEYVRRQTANFVATYRGDEQRPILLRAANTDEGAVERQLVEYGPTLLDVGKPDSAEVVKARQQRLEEVSARWAEIRREGWDKYEALSKKAIRHHPLKWQQFEHLLLRLERLTVSGNAKTYRDQFEDGIKNKLPELIKTFEEEDQTLSPPNSLALAASLGSNRYAADVKALDAAATALNSGKDAIEGPDAASYLFRAQAAWSWLAKSPSAADLEQRLERLHQRVLPTSGNWHLEDEPVEIHFARMLAAHRNRRERFDAGQIAAAIARRDAAESAAAPLDVRVHYFTRPVTTVGDEARRKAEDALFVGRTKDNSAITASDSAAKDAYAQAERLEGALSDAFALRDQALADIPWLVRYRARRLEAGTPTDVDDKAIIALAELHADLKRQISDFAAIQPVSGLYDKAAVDKFAGQTADSKTRYESLRQPIIKALRERSAQGSASDRLRLLDAMALPLLVGVDRQRLHEQAKAVFADEFHYRELAPERTGEATAEGRTDHHVARMLKWPIHPALSLVGAPLGDIKPNERTSLAAVGTALRKKLIEIESLVKSAKDTAGDLSLELATKPPSARTALADADLTSRAAGLYRGLVPKFSPAERLERFDRQRLLVWHFQRTLDDFWGPSPEKLDKTFFHVAAQRFAALAARQDDEIDARSPAANSQADEMRRRIAGRDKAAIDGLAPRFDAEYRQIRIDPKATSKQPVDQFVHIDRAADADLPGGTAAYYLAEASDTEAPQATADATLAALSGQQVQTVDSRLAYDVASSRGGDSRLLDRYTISDPYGQSERTRFLRGMVLYRGHRFRHPTETVEIVLAGCEREYEFKPPKYGPPTVTIAGSQKPRAVLIVLDCSGSMKENNRMAIAKQAVKAAIAELRAGGSDKRVAQVGLFLYGHRTRYQNDQAPNMEAALLTSDYEKNISKSDIRPPADVEERVELSALTPGVESEIKRWVEAVREYGNTPLYCAIHEALTSGFDNLKNPELYERQILVLSDGANWVYENDTKVPAKDQSRVFIDDKMLKAALKTSRAESIDKGLTPIRLDIVGYDFVDSTAQVVGGWRIGSRQELKGVLDEGPEGADENDLGFIHDIQSEASAEISTEKKLQLLLQSLLGVYRFRIVDANSGALVPITVDDKPAAELLRLGKPMTFGKSTGRFKVNFEGNVRGLAGGAPPEDFEFDLRNRAERVLLRIHENRKGGSLVRWLEQEDQAPDRLDYRISDRENRGQDLVDLNNRQIAIFPRPPIWDSETAGVKFRVALSYPAGPDNFASQPVEALAIIQPRRNDVAPITIYDVTFEPGTNVPEMNFVVPEWRDKAGRADQAYVTVWFKMDRETTPLDKFPVNSSPKTIDVAGSPVTYSVKYDRDENRRVYVVKVTERHVKEGDARPKSMDQIKVSMEDQPARTHRCYITGGKEVVHTFEFPERAGLDLDKLREYKILLTRLDDMKRNSIHTHEAENKAMLVDVPTNR